MQAGKPVDRVTLMEFEPAQLVELVDMWRACFEYGLGIKDPNPIEQQRTFFVSKVLPDHSVRVAMLEGEMVGFVAASRSCVAQLHVRLEFLRSGIGSKLLAWAKAQSDGSLWLYTFARNAGARAFYERHGFVVAERGFEPTWQLEDIKYTWTRVSDVLPQSSASRRAPRP